MDKDKEYIISEIIPKTEIDKETINRRIGRKGMFIRLVKGMRFEFYDINNENCLRSSKVESIEDIENGILVHTLNSIYKFNFA